jgi:hypothetical protein
MLRELEQNGLHIPITKDLRKAIDSMNTVVHGFEVSEEDASEAERIGTAFLAEIQRLDGN